MKKKGKTVSDTPNQKRSKEELRGITIDLSGSKSTRDTHPKVEANN